MGKNIAQKRAAKAQRRKAIVADKRKADIAASGGSLAERVRRAALGPIRACVMQQEIFTIGVGMVILVRESPLGPGLGGFLVDTSAGVKDVFFRDLTETELDHYLDAASQTGALVDVAPADARRLLADANRHALALGRQMHRDFARVEALFGDVRIEDATVSFFEGHEDPAPEMADAADAAASAPVEGDRAADREA